MEEKTESLRSTTPLPFHIETMKPTNPNPSPPPTPQPTNAASGTKFERRRSVRFDRNLTGLSGFQRFGFVLFSTRNRFFKKCQTVVSFFPVVFHTLSDWPFTVKLGFYQIGPDRVFNRFLWVRQGFYWVWLGFTWFRWISAVFHYVLLCFTGFYYGFTRF